MNLQRILLPTAAGERSLVLRSVFASPIHRELIGNSRNLVCNLARTKSSYPTTSETAPEGKLSAVLVTLALSGATTGTLLDGIHSRVGVLIYDSAPLQLGGLSTSAWVPPLLAAFYFVMGGLVIFFDSRMAAYDPTTRGALREANLFKLVVSFGALAAMLELSSYLYSSDVKSSTICLAMALCAAINYLVLDSTKQGLALALLCALGAPLIELVLMQSMHLWHYPQGDLHTTVAGVSYPFSPAVEAAQLKTGSKFNTLNGEPVLVEGQQIEQAPKYKLCGFLDIHLESNFIDEDHEPLICDIKACNALLHSIDYPLVPNNSQLRALLPEGKFKTGPSG